MKCCDNPNCQKTASFYHNSLSDIAIQLIGTDDICDKQKSRLLIHLAHTLTVTAHGIDCSILGTQKLATLDNSALVLTPQSAIAEIMPIIQRHVKADHGDG